MIFRNRDDLARLIVAGWVRRPRGSFDPESYDDAWSAADTVLALLQERAAKPREPQIHSHITDMLPVGHPLVDYAECGTCGVMVHSVPNECMTAWVETGRGPRCLECFAKEFVDGDDSWGLPE